jgi:hypothetical protein
MDEAVRRSARARAGVVLSSELGAHPGRSAAKSDLVPVHPGAWVAGTQPVDAWVRMRAVAAVVGDREWAAMDEAALWLYGCADKPVRVAVGVPLGHKLAAHDGVEVRRVVPWVLQGARVLKGIKVVALEIAVVQAAARLAHSEVRELVENVVRDRRTTLARLRARRRRGLKGSARIGQVCDELAGGSMDADVRRLKVALEARGVTGLRTEVHFESEAGGSAYGDLFHDASLTLFEVDGFVTHALREVFRSDRRRDRWMHRLHRVVTHRIDVLEIREDLEGLADELAPELLAAQQSAAA